MNYACLVLPFPPTTNNLFAGTKRRFVSNGYAAWKLAASVALLKQRPIPAFDCPVDMTLRLGRPDKRRRDLANYEKAVSDLLVEHGILSDDSMIHKLTMFWSNDVHGVQIEIEPYDDCRALAGKVA